MAPIGHSTERGHRLFSFLTLDIYISKNAPSRSLSASGATTDDLTYAELGGSNYCVLSVLNILFQFPLNIARKILSIPKFCYTDYTRTGLSPTKYSDCLY